ncbi:helix-turn-helix transcriptional regulator [Methylobacter luteus]|uniref:helix-turn-helix transcriptional regulator n=1 Tax=Methylobacter luteus TaxID=415 RepID=UPI00040B5058|nr:helix-turn-helix domain-containing protein [Methylobacter luteus]
MYKFNRPSQRTLTEKQLSERWGLSPKTFQDWRYKGIGPAFVKIGRSVRYLEADIIAFEEKRKVSSTSAPLNQI